ncbi:Leukemia inhibitory factor receptor [Triplophysa tibetana]|uniref:Leukemia inhibitory factor receptor n=1 Tax=Triplophysa tibetana TaxID=1572043 RepID=A0A5A9P6C8_9TELE|nr:Leukemia inhibitory factor receptor [Triplophysa tibetana]
MQVTLDRSVCQMPKYINEITFIFSLIFQNQAPVAGLEFYPRSINENLLEQEQVFTLKAVKRCGFIENSTSTLEVTSFSTEVKLQHQQYNSLSQQCPCEAEVLIVFSIVTYFQDEYLLATTTAVCACMTRKAKLFQIIRVAAEKSRALCVSRRAEQTDDMLVFSSSSLGLLTVCFSSMSYCIAVVFIPGKKIHLDVHCSQNDPAIVCCIVTKMWYTGSDVPEQSYSKMYPQDKVVHVGNNMTFCCIVREKKLSCSWTSWEQNWTLVAQNPLGSVQLTDSAPLADRVHLLAPVDVTAVDVKAWNVTLKWRWSVAAYKKLDMICQLKLNSLELTVTRNFSATGLSSVLMDGLWPDVGYSVSVRCGSLHGFWKWGDESAPYRIHTKMERPDPPDVWIWMDSETSGWVLWKPLSVSESHGALDGFEVSQSDRWSTVSLSHNNFSYPITLTNTSDINVTVAARNPAGLSQPSAVTVPAFRADSLLKVSELTGTNGGFDLRWRCDVNVSGGFVVEWIPTGCSGLCAVNWLKVPGSNSSVRVPSESLEAGVRYTVSVYSLSAGAPVVLERWNGYTQELPPSESVVKLSPVQISSDVLLSWKAVSMKQQRGFIRGYSVYLANAARLQLIANVSDPDVSSYKVTGLSPGSYKFVVKAYNSAGEDSGSTVAIKLEINMDMMVVGILVSLGSMFFCLILISIFCYKRRDWVKKAFYPEIPGPKVSGDWCSPQGPLDVKPSPHSLVHIVESPEWDFGKKGLVPVPEEEMESVDVDTDSDEPALLKYYNQVVGEDSRSNPLSDSSGSSTFSVDSGQTEVTYTGIQSPTASRGGGYRPQMQPVSGPDESNGGFQSDFQEENSSSGYKPQGTSAFHSFNGRLCESRNSVFQLLNHSHEGDQSTAGQFLYAVCVSAPLYFSLEIFKLLKTNRSKYRKKSKWITNVYSSRKV